MSRLHRRLGAAAALVLAAVPAGLGGARAAEGALVVIFDGSGSMWGAVGNSRQTKVVMAREALRRGLGKLAPDARVGLALFGHRRGACTDPEVVQPPEPLDVAKLMAPLDQLDPRGRGPITLAVREAAKSLPADAKPRTLLLIHDDADNCQPDLCSAAAELQAAGITAHVVGLGVKTEDMAKMTCLSQATGGRHFNAQTGEQVAGYIEEALLLAASAMGGVQAIELRSFGTDRGDRAGPAGGLLCEVEVLEHQRRGEAGAVVVVGGARRHRPGHRAVGGERPALAG